MINSDVFVLAYIVAFFAAFIIPVGGVSTWIMISDLKEQAAARRRDRTAASHSVLKAA